MRALALATQPSAVAPARLPRCCPVWSVVPALSWGVREGGPISLASVIRAHLPRVHGGAVH